MRIVLLGCALAAVAGCNDPSYFNERCALKTTDDPDGGMTITDDTDFVAIPFRKPDTDELRVLTDLQKARNLPMPAGRIANGATGPRWVPWISTDDMPVEIEYTIHNLDGVPGKAFFSVVGCNEFSRGDPMDNGNCYNPGAFVDPLANQENQVIPPPLMGSAPIDLQPGEAKALVFREDDFLEAAKNLEAIARYPSSNDMSAPFKVITTRSDSCTTTVCPGRENVPPNDVYPQLTLINFHLSADIHVTVDYTVRVRDLHGRLQPNDDSLIAEANGDAGVAACR
jgi:hypothetical protein